MRALAPLVVLAVACGGPPAADLVTIDTLPGGIVRVVNHGPSEWADTNGWRLVLERTIQPGEGEPGVLLNPGWMSLRPDGALLVTDGPPVVVKRFGADGSYLGTIGREGEGPGEYQSAYPLWLGDTILVQDSRGPGRLVRFTAEGNALGTTPGVCCVGGTGPRRDANGIRVLGAGPHDLARPTKFTYQWIWFDTAGARIDSMVVPEAGEPKAWTIAQGGGVATYSIPFTPQSIALPLSDGRIVLGFGDAYRLAVLTRPGDTTRVFERVDAPVAQIPESVRQARFDQITSGPLDPTVVALDDIPTSFPVFDDILEDGQGHIWLHRPVARGSQDMMDIFSPDGIYLGTLRVPEHEGVLRLEIAGDRVAILDTDTDDLPRIRIYRIDRGR